MLCSERNEWPVAGSIHSLRSGRVGKALRMGTLLAFMMSAVLLLLPEKILLAG